MFTNWYRAIYQHPNTGTIINGQLLRPLLDGDVLRFWGLFFEDASLWRSEALQGLYWVELCGIVL